MNCLQWNDSATSSKKKLYHTAKSSFKVSKNTQLRISSKHTSHCKKGANTSLYLVMHTRGRKGRLIMCINMYATLWTCVTHIIAAFLQLLKSQGYIWIRTWRLLLWICIKCSHTIQWYTAQCQLKWRSKPVHASTLIFVTTKLS